MVFFLEETFLQALHHPSCVGFYSIFSRSFFPLRQHNFYMASNTESLHFCRQHRVTNITSSNLSDSEVLGL